MQFYIPSRHYILNLKVGDLAPTSFGDYRKVVEIYAQQDDINGKAFICYYHELGEGSMMSMSIKENELVRSVNFTGKYTSWELDDIEKQTLA
jgi:hypothetical protein